MSPTADSVILTGRRSGAPLLLAVALSMLAIFSYGLGGAPSALAQDGDDVRKLGPGGARGYEPANVSVTPGHNELRVSWTVTSRPGVEDDEIYHALRWSQTTGSWDNPGMLPWDQGGLFTRLEAKHGILIEPGVTSYTIEGLANRKVTGVHVRSFVGIRRTQEAEKSSQWVRVRGASTTPVGDDVIFDKAGYSVAEGGTVSLGLSRNAINNASLNDPLTVTLATADGTAASSDYTAFSSRSVAMAARATAASSSVVTTSDDLVEEDETFTVSLSTPDGSTFRPGIPATAKVTITDDDRAGARIAFGTSAASTAKHTAAVSEAVTGATLNVPVTVSHLPGTSTTFNVQVLSTGTAAEGSDFTIAAKTVTFGPDTAKTKNVSIAFTDDTDHEPDETIELRIAAADSPANDLGDHYARHSAGATAAVTVTNDDPPLAPKTYALRGDVSATEGGNAALTLLLGENAPTGGLAFRVAATYATAAAGRAAPRDTNNFVSTIHTVTAGKSSDTITIPIAADALVEGSETFTVTVTANDNGWSVDSHRGNAATITIISRDRATARIAFGSAAASTVKYTTTVSEAVAGATLNVPVTVSHLPGASTTFAVELLSAGTAAEDNDFTIATKSVTFGPDSSKTRNVAISLTDDTDYELDETIELRIAAADSPVNDLGDHYARHSAGATATVTVTSDESRIAFGTDPGSTARYTDRVSEAVTGATLNVPVTVSHLPRASTTFTVEVLSTGTATEYIDDDNPGDYRIATKTVTFGPADTSRTKNVAITLTDDTDYETDETIELRIAAADSHANDLGDHYARDAGATATVIIVSDDTTTKIVDGGGGASGSEPTNVSVTPGDGELTVTWTVTSREGVDDDEIYHALRWSQTLGAWDNPKMARHPDWPGTPLPSEHGMIIEPGVNSYTIRGLANRKVTGVHVRSLTGVFRTQGAQQSSRWVRVRGSSTTPVGDVVMLDEAGHSIAEGGTVRLGLTRHGATDTSLDSSLTVTLDTADSTAASSDYTAFSSRPVAMAANAATAGASVVTTSDDLVEEDETFTVSLSTPDGSEFRAGEPSTATVTIQDDDRASARIAFGASAASTAKHTATVSEAVTGATLNVPVTVSHLPGASTTFTVQVLSSGTATEGSDFSIASKTVTFAPTDTSRTKNVAITLTDDTDYETDETIELRIAAADAVVDDLGDHYARHSAGATATVTVTSDETRIAFGTDPGSTTKHTATVSEAVTGATLNVPVTVSHLPSASTTFTVQVLSTGTATEGSDFTISSKTVTFGPNSSRTKNVAITLTDDPDYETDETIELQIAAADDPADDLGDHYARDAGATATVTVTSDETRIAFGTDPGSTTKHTATVSEAVTGATLNVPVTVSHLPSASTTFTVKVLSTGTATEYVDDDNPGDYRIANKAVTFGPADTGRTKNVAITLTDDTDYETDETIELQIAAADDPVNDLGDHYARDAGATATVTVTSDETRIAFGTDPGSTTKHTATVSEAVTGATLNVPVTVSHLPSASTTFTVKVLSTGTATEGSDFTIATKTVTFAPDDSTRTKNVAITLTDDTDYETDETIDLRIAAAASPADRYARHSAGATATVTVTSDDSHYVLVGQSSVTVEAGKTATYTVVLSDEPTQDVTVTPVSSSDKATVSGTATFSRTNWNVPQEVTVTGASAGSATISHRVSSDDTNFSSDKTQSAGVSVTAAPKLYEITAAVTAAEDKTAALTVTLSEAAPAATTFRVAYTYGNSSATAADTGSGRPTTVTVAAGDTTATLSVPIARDSLVESDETLRLRIAPVGDAASQWAKKADGADVAAITITDATIAISTSQTEYSVGEGDGSITIPVTFSSATLEEVTLRIRSGGLSGSPDYSHPSSLTVAKGATTANFTVTILDDSRRENAERFWTRLDVTTPAAGYAPVIAGITINDNDTAGVVVSRDGVTVRKGSTVTYTVKLQSRPSTAVIVTPASSATDKATVSGIALFSVADWNRPKTITVTGVETGAAVISHSVRATGDSFYSALTVDSVNVTVATDKAYGISSAVTANEGGNAELTVTLLKDAPAGGLEFTVTPSYGTGAGKAAANDLGTPPATVSVAADGRTATLRIPIAQDALVEGDETFTVSVSAAGWSEKADGAGTATVTITDDDVARTVSLAAANYSVGESDGKVTVGLSVSGAHDDTITATVTFTDSGATRNEDYGGSSATAQVSFAPDETAATLDIAVTDDSLIEGSETFTVAVTAVSGPHTVGSPSQATVTITDDDAAGATVGPTSLSIVEFGSKSYTVVLNTKPSANVIVTPTSSATAHAKVGGALTFTPTNWDTAQPVSVTGVLEGSATISHAVTSDDTGYAAVTPDPVAVTVTPYSKTYTITRAATVREGRSVPLVITLGERPPAGGLTFGIEAAFGAPASDKAQLADIEAGYLPRVSSVTVPSDKDEARFSIPIVVGDLLEEDETFTVSITSVTNSGSPVPLWKLDPGGTKTATVTITDGDAANAGIAFGTDAAATARYTANVSENVSGGTLSVPVTVSHLPAKSSSFTIEVAGTGTATEYVDDTNPGDYRIADKTVSFGPDDAGRTQNVAITITDDADVEGPETIVLSIAAAADEATELSDHYARHASGAAATITINSDDAAAGSTKTYTIASSATADEGGNAELTVTLGENAPTGGLNFTVSYDYSGGTATSADTGTTPATLSVNAGSKTATLSVPIARDSAKENPETFTVTISTAAAGWAKASGGTDTATVTITDATPTIRMSASAYTVIEGEPARLVVTRSGPTTDEAQVSYIGFGRGPVRGVPGYFSGTVTIPAGSDSAALVIETKDDEVVQGRGSVGIIVQRPSDGYYLDGPTYVFLYIQENDGEQQYTTTYTLKGDVTASEGTDAVLTINLGQAVHPDGLVFTVNYDYSGGATEDDTGAAPSTLSVAAGSTSATLRIPIASDTEDDPDETFVVSITPGTGDTDWALAPSGSASATVSISEGAAAQILGAAAQSEPVSFGTATVSDQAYTVGAWAPYPADDTAAQERHKLPAATGGAGVLTYTATGLPAGLTMGQDRIIRGTPEAATTSPVTVTYTAADGEGENADSASLTFQVTVNPPVTFDEAELGPFIYDTIEYTVGQASPLNVVLPAATGGTGTLTYYLDNRDPRTPIGVHAQGLSFNAVTRVLSSGTGPQEPAAPQSYALAYWAEDEKGAQSAPAFSSLSVAAAPSLEAVADQDFTVGDAVSVTLPAATGGATKIVPLSYSLEPQVPGLSFNSASRTLSGTATATGTTEVTYTVTDRNGVTGTTTFTITVNNVVAEDDESEQGDDPAAPTEAPGSVQAYGDPGRKEFVVTWTAVPGATSYAVQVTADGDSFPSGNAISDWPDGYHVSVLRGSLMAGVVVPEYGRYSVRVVAVNAEGAGPWATITVTVSE